MILLRKQLFNIRKIQSYWIYVILAILSLYLKSRGLFLGTCISLLYILCITKSVNKKIRYYLFFFFLLAFILLFFIKFGSSFGRILIYKISFEIFKDNWLHGIGIGNLKKIYPLYQEKHFESGNYSERELLTADDTYYVFNEYYTLVLELGILIIPVIIGFLYIIHKNLKSQLIYRQSHYEILLNTFMITFLAYSFFNFTFSAYTYWYIIFVCTLIATFLYDSNMRKIFVLISLTLFSIAYINLYSNEVKLANLEQMYRARIDENSVRQRLDCFTTADFNLYVRYLNLKSQIYIDKNHWTEAKYVTKELVRTRPKSIYYSRYALTLEKTGNLVEAEQYLIKAVNLVPNRFLTRYELFKFYVRHDKIEHAKKVGREIMRLNVKIPSTLIDNIKQDVNQKINRYEKKI